MGKYTIILALTVRRILWIYQVLSFVVSRDTSHRSEIMLLVGNFTGVIDGHEFYPRLGICNCKSVWSTDKFVRKLIILGKNESPLEKKKAISLKDIFFKQF